MVGRQKKFHSPVRASRCAPLLLLAILLCAPLLPLVAIAEESPVWKFDFWDVFYDIAFLDEVVRVRRDAPPAEDEGPTKIELE